MDAQIKTIGVLIDVTLRIKFQYMGGMYLWDGGDIVSNIFPGESLELPALSMG